VSIVCKCIYKIAHGFGIGGVKKTGQRQCDQVVKMLAIWGKNYPKLFFVWTTYLSNLPYFL
jgi:hypothetical protein